MLKFISRRLLHMIPLVFGITLLSFLILNLAPGDYFNQLALNPEISPETLEQMRQEFGLDKPVMVQYFKWLQGVLTFNFGYSIHFKVPVVVLIKQRMMNTLILSITAMIFCWILSVPIGVYCAVRQYSIGDKIFSILAFLGIAIPNFFLAFLLIYWAAATGKFPTGGMTSVSYETLSFGMRLVDRLKHLIIPTVVLGTAGMAGLTRLMRGNLLENLRAPYVIAARARGLAERKVIFKHALRNAINPMITIFGYELSALFSAAALTEIITSWPGLGKLMLDAARSQDIYLVMGALLMSSVLLILGNLVADILLAMSDPRIRYR